MIRFLLVMLLLVGFLSFGTFPWPAIAADAPNTSPVQPTIIGGQSAAAGEFPYMVALVQAGGNQFCGGSLIDPSWVLTAAHCFFNDQNVQDTFPADVNIVVGTVDVTNGSGQAIAVTRIVHPGYDQNRALDIALLQLAQPANTADAAIGVIPVNTGRGTPAIGQDSTITGWGATAPNGTGSPDVLQKLQVPVVACDQGDDPNLFVCAGGVAGEDSCQGDSGGPLVVSDGGGGFLQVGVTSTGPEICAQAGQYGVYTRVSQYTNWINQTIGMEPVVYTSALFIPLIRR